MSSMPATVRHILSAVECSGQNIESLFKKFIFFFCLLALFGSFAIIEDLEYL